MKRLLQNHKSHCQLATHIEFPTNKTDVSYMIFFIRADQAHSVDEYGSETKLEQVSLPYTLVLPM